MATSKDTCSECGSVYEVTKHKLMMRDSDKAECEVYGNVLLEWNGATTFDYKLIVRGAKPSADRSPS